MPVSPLDSQLADLEELRDAIVLDGRLAPGMLIAQVRRRLRENGITSAAANPVPSAPRSSG